MARMAEPGYFERQIKPETVTVHLWRSMFRKVLGDEIPSDSLRKQLSSTSKLSCGLHRTTHALLWIVGMPAARRDNRSPSPS